MLSLSVRRNGFVAVLAPGLLFGAIAVLAPSPAGAHFKITNPTTPPKPDTVQSWMSEDSAGGPQKNGPCAAVPNTALGDSPGTPTHAITVVQSGQPVTIPITVTIAHPGWFRIALVEGSSSSQTLATLADPVAQTGTPPICPLVPNTPTPKINPGCWPTIMDNPVWSPTQPILADGLPAGSTACTTQSGTKTFQVTIPPTASCTSAKPCTLQAIMVMTDHPTGDCYYHHCADISMASATTGGGGSSGAGPNGGSGGASEPSGAGGSTISGGGTGVAGGPGTVATGAGASPGAGGSIATGGTGAGAGTGAGGSVTPGGSAGTSGAAGQPGGAGTGTGSGGSAATGSGASTEPVSSSGSSGCSYVLASRGGASWAVSAAGLLALVLARRRRRPR
jgi:hypothetical protein